MKLLLLLRHFNIQIRFPNDDVYFNLQHPTDVDADAGIRTSAVPFLFVLDKINPIYHASAAKFHLITGV